MSKVNLISAVTSLCAGLFLLVYLGFFFIRRPHICVRKTLAGLRSRDERRALTLALAGTLGVGNIYGVALGIMVGGAGSVFWLFISSIFAMVIKYSECVLAADGNFSGKGMMVPIEDTFGKAGKLIARIYCLLMLLLSLFMGAFIQSDSIITSASSFLPPSKILIASIFLISIFVATFRGGEGIKNVAEMAIPVASAFYIALCLIIIIKRADMIPGVVVYVMRSAFEPRALLSGVAISQGFCRGLLSNEAGAGTSAMAHSEVKRSAADAGLFGILEVFFDTDLLCMLTAAVILLEVDSPGKYLAPMDLVFSAFSSGAGKLSLVPLLICIFLFAHSTVICWYYYGTRCLEYLGVKNLTIPFVCTFFVFIISPAFICGYFAVFA